MDGAELKAEEKADGGANGDRFRQGRRRGQLSNGHVTKAAFSYSQCPHATYVGRRIEFGGLAKRQIFPSNYVLDSVRSPIFASEVALQQGLRAQHRCRCRIEFDDFYVDYLG